MGKVIRHIEAVGCLAAGIYMIWFLGVSGKLQVYDMFYIFLFVVCLEVCLLMSIYIGTKEIDKEKDKGIIGRGYSLKNVWLRSAIIWMLVAYWMISSSLLSTMIVIYISSDKDNNIDTNRIIFYSIASLFVSVMYYSLNPMSISRGYRKAFHDINRAILMTENQNDEREKLLTDSIVRGEEYIEKYSYEIKS